MLTLDSVVLRFLKFGHSRRRLVQPIVLLLFLVFFALAALAEPMLDWDMLAYVANAYQYLGLVPSEEVHRTVYTDLQSSVPAADFERLISSPSRQVLYQDPEAFRQTIAFFYDTRVIYTGMVAGLIKLGLNPFFATYFISTLCAVGSVLLLARLVPTKLPLAMSLALPFIALSCGLLDVARDSSPDSLATLVTIALYWVLLRDKIPLLLVLLPLVVFVRTDLIFLAALFHGYFLFGGRVSKIAVILSGVSTIAAYLLLTMFIVDGDPWSSVIGYNYGEKPTHPEKYTFDITINSYIGFILIGLKSLSYNPIFFVFCAFTSTGIYMYLCRFYFDKTNSKTSHLHLDLLFILVSGLLYFIVHFLFFPVTWIRFFVAQYSLAAVVVLWTSLSIMAERNYSGRTNVDLLNH